MDNKYKNSIGDQIRTFQCQTRHYHCLQLSQQSLMGWQIISWKELRFSGPEPTSDLVSLAAHCRYYQGIIQNDSSALNTAFPCEVKFMSSLTMDRHWVSHKWNHFYWIVLGQNYLMIKGSLYKIYFILLLEIDIWSIERYFIISLLPIYCHTKLI